MTVDKLYRLFQEKCASDPSLRSLKRKINSGKADFTDTAAYSERISNLLGQTLSKYINGIPEGSREQICNWLLQEQYKDTNTICAVVQEALDEAQGIRLTPQKASFPSERVQTVAHALEDPTVKPETIRRRADAPVANVAKSFHDDYIKVNARVRNDLGLKPTITRYGTSCCAWCSAVAGKYRFGEQPEDIFRRHDNCNCTIIYDTQVLRGSRSENGGRSKTWEEVDPSDVEQNLPTVLSQEQAENLQNTALQGLTLAGRRDIISIGNNAMSRRKKDGKIEPMPKKQFQTIVKRFKAQGGIFQFDEETDKYLDSRNAEAITYDAKTILIRRKPGRASVFEELIHTAQYRNGRNDGSYPSRLRCEIEAQEKLLRNAKAYHLTEPEIYQTQKALEAYQKELDVYLKHGGE